MDDSDIELTTEEWRELQRLALGRGGLRRADGRADRLCAAGLATLSDGTLRITEAGRRRMVRGSPLLWSQAA